MTEENLKVAVRVRPFISLLGASGCVVGGPRVMGRRVVQNDGTRVCVRVSPWMLTCYLDYSRFYDVCWRWCDLCRVDGAVKVRGRREGEEGEGDNRHRQ